MKLTSRLIACHMTTLIIVATLLSVACAPGSMVVLATTAEPTSTATPTATPSPAPGLIPTSTPVFKSVSDQQKQDFIKKTGEYTYDNMKNKLFCVGAREDKIYNLGVVNYDCNSTFREVVVQGWLLSYREENGNLVLEVGFDSRDSTERVIKDVLIPLYFYQQNRGSGIGLGFINYDFWERADSTITDLGMKNNANSIVDQISNFMDKPMLFEFYSYFSAVPRLIELYGEKAAKSSVDLINSNSSAVNQLLCEISDNGENIKYSVTFEPESGALILAGVYACFN